MIVDRNVSLKTGTAPGTLVHIGEEKVEKPAIHVLAYDAEKVREIGDATLEECFSSIKEELVTWIDVTGLHDVGLIQKLGESLGIHSLVLEDILNTSHRPKVEFFDDYIYTVVKFIHYISAENRIEIEQVSILLGKGFVVTFQERPRDPFDALRERIRRGTGRWRKARPDYLYYAVLDNIVDTYFEDMEALGEDLEELQDVTVTDPSPEVMQRIFAHRLNMQLMRRAIFPVRDMVNHILQTDSAFFKKDMPPFFRDIYDHVARLIDNIEIARDMAATLIELHMAVTNQRMNEIMKVLTIMATLFIPLTFVAGVYGMNFKFMPELEWRWGYFAALGGMGAAAAGMLVYFRRKKWF
ncbi:MAG: magnesium/cobalt transporter CorA [bacterium]|nr:magnesium/cobalt transporter CorA [bacterium]